MTSYKVFLRAPSTAELKRNDKTGSSFNWHTVEGLLISNNQDNSSITHSSSKNFQSHNVPPFLLSLESPEKAQEWLIAPASLDAATQRMSDMYKNVIFAEDEEDVDESFPFRTEETDPKVTDETRMILWPPTNTDSNNARSRSYSRLNITERGESQDTTSTSYAHTSTSSIMAFPTFVINLHTLSSLSSLNSLATSAYSKDTRPGMATASGRWSQKGNLLVAVLEVEGPDTVTIKRGPDAGKEVTLLKLIVGDESGVVSKLTAWRETAERWSGLLSQDIHENTSDLANEAVTRGDVVYITNALAALSNQNQKGSTSETSSTKPAVVLTASPNLSSQLNICYRTLPYAPSDKRFRPDLRLAVSDAGVRKVATVATWLERAIGLSD